MWNVEKKRKKRKEKKCRKKKKKIQTEKGGGGGLGIDVDYRKKMQGLGGNGWRRGGGLFVGDVECGNKNKGDWEG